MTSPTKRRTKEEMGYLREALREIVTKNEPVTCRQVFYLAVSTGLIPKNESAYKNVIARLLADMRRAGEIPYDHIVDYTRTMRKPQSWNSIEDALNETARIYRRNIWPDLGERVEIWSEKETLTGVLLEETWMYDVPLMPTRGYPSLSFLYGAADEIKAAGLPTYIYYFGDLDPSGVDIPTKVEKGLREFAPNAEINFERLAVLPQQVKAYKLQTRPTKKSDSRSKNFFGESVEVDAIPPHILRGICKVAIRSHISDSMLKDFELIEKEERKIIELFAKQAA